MNPQPTNFTDLNNPKPSYMTLLRQQNDIPSLSYSYTAGAQYRLKEALGSLILGGYDTSRFTAANTSFTFFSDQTRDLTVGLQSITTNATGSETNLLSSAIYIFIDSSIAQLYLPISACQAFEKAFGLIYNTTVGLYLVNDTLHTKLLNSNPSVTFTLGNTISSGETFNISLPYASFDLQAEYPLVSNSSRYFPLQRAANDSQYTLGRTFLQEAYLIVDYERGNFSVNPCVWDSDAASHIVSIPGVNSTSSTNSTGTVGGGGGGGSSNAGNGLSIGALVGIVIGIIVIVFAVSGCLLWFLVLVPRRKKREAKEPEGQSTEPLPHEVEGDPKPPSPKELHDIGHPPAQAELPSRPPELSGLEIYEMPGSDVPEMPANPEATVWPDEKKVRKKFSWESP